MVSPSRCPPWQPERPGPTRREPRRAQRSYTTPRDTILARESGVETPTAEDLARLERKRKGKKLSNTDWVSKSEPEAKIAKIAKMKDGTTHLAYKPEHAVDLDTGAVVAAELHPESSPVRSFRKSSTARLR